MSDPDLIHWLDAELEVQQVRNAVAYDREAALIELRSLCHRWAAERQTATLTLPEAELMAHTVEERARLASLFRRITTTTHDEGDPE